MNLQMLEKALFKVLEDLEPYLDSLVLVGGWVPYLYRNYLWEEEIELPVHTTDIDFGFAEAKGSSPSKSVYQKLSGLHYLEKHIAMDRMFPIVPAVAVSNKDQPIPVEFLTDQQTPVAVLDKFFGCQIKINRLDHFSMLLKEPISVVVEAKKKITVFVPNPARFVLHKILTHGLRQNPIKQQKDAYYAYYVLRFHPDTEALLNGIQKVKLGKEAGLIRKTLERSFADPQSPGVLQIEKELGVHYFSKEFRQDIFKRFEDLLVFI